MTISKTFGWVSFGAALLGSAWIVFAITNWAVGDPKLDPSMEALKLFFGPIWWIVWVAVASFIASKIFKWLGE